MANLGKGCPLCGSDASTRFDPGPRLLLIDCKNCPPYSLAEDLGPLKSYSRELLPKVAEIFRSRHANATSRVTLDLAEFGTLVADLNKPPIEPVE